MGQDPLKLYVGGKSLTCYFSCFHLAFFKCLFIYFERERERERARAREGAPVQVGEEQREREGERENPWDSGIDLMNCEIMI